jgi:hypothetical protein
MCMKRGTNRIISCTKEQNVKIEKPKPELRDADVFPDEEVLKSVLGRSYAAYSDLIKLAEELGLSLDWKFYNDVKNWLWRISLKKKTIVWMSAWKGFLKATVYFPEKYIKEVNNLTVRIKSDNHEIAIQKVGKSRAFIFEIRDQAVLDKLRLAIEVKISLK